jgi:cyanate permease
MHARREPNFSLRAAGVALGAAAAIGATGWLAVEGEYSLWAWAAALALIPWLAEVDEENGDMPAADSPPADRVMAGYTQAVSL